MSTTRHLVNRRRRLATAPPRTPGAEADPAPRPDTVVAATTTEPDAQAEPSTEADTAPEAPADASREGTSRLRGALPVVLCALTVLLGAFAAWAFASADDLRDEPARQNTALTDIGRTSEVKGRISEAVGAVFSYDYASPARSDRAATTYLTGRAVQQHKDMLADVREQAPKQKLVLTTTVTESGVEFLDGDRARLLVFADQSNTRTGKDEETTHAAAMFAVDAVRRGDTWLIAAIDTFTR
jgi:Mce-associated membrane protein